HTPGHKPKPGGAVATEATTLREKSRHVRSSTLVEIIYADYCCSQRTTAPHSKWEKLIVQLTSKRWNAVDPFPGINCVNDMLPRL
ncbi:MAG: hypothetical protein WCD70_04355, partial [Alphaproteobacteria bacterium]